MKFLFTFIFLSRLATAGGVEFPTGGCALEGLSQSVDPFRVLIAPHWRLNAVAKPISNHVFGSNWLYELVLRMTRTLMETQGVGIAAPQIGQLNRVFLVRVPRSALQRHPEMEERPLTVVINPEIEVLDPKAYGYREGCLSIPGKTGVVIRPRHIRVRYRDVDGGRHEEEIFGANAIIFQHENDHLDGRLISQRWVDVKETAPR